MSLTAQWISCYTKRSRASAILGTDELKMGNWYINITLPFAVLRCIIWVDKDNKILMNYLQLIQNKAAKAHTAWFVTLEFGNWCIKAADLLPSPVRRFHHRCLMMHKCLINAFDYDYDLQFNNKVHLHNPVTRMRETKNCVSPRVGLSSHLGRCH